MTCLTAENYYEEGYPPARHPARSRCLSPQENAARYFKQYTKAKTAEKILTEQLVRGRGRSCEYLESVRAGAGSRPRAGAGFQRHPRGADGRRLYPPAAAGSSRASSGQSKPRGCSARRRVCGSSSGRNNRQNDKLTTQARLTSAGHLAAHAKDRRLPRHPLHRRRGAGRARVCSKRRASLAAYYLTGRGRARNVPVDYTPVKFVKKPAGRPPRHGDLYNLSDDLRRTGRGAGPPPVGEIRQAPGVHFLRGL